MKLKMILNSLLRYDIASGLAQKYKKIPSLYKKTFWTVFVILNIVFAFHTISFFWSNHEWPVMKGHISPTYHWYEARFTQTIPYILMGSRILPVLMNIFGFLGLSLSTIALAIYWKLPKRTCAYIGFCLVVALMPYNLIWLYHTAQTSYFWGGAIIVGALEIYEHKCRKLSAILWHILVIGLLFFVLGMNASYINTIFIFIIGRYFIEFIEKGCVGTLFKKSCILFLDIVLAVLLLKGCVMMADHYHVLWKLYNIQHITVDKIPAKFLKILPYMWEQFNITYPFLDSTYLWLLKGMGILALMTVLLLGIHRRGWVMGVIVFFAMIAGLLIASQLTTLIAPSEYIPFWLRITGYFGHYYIFSLMIAFLFCFFRPIFLKNLLFLLTVILITFEVQRDMYAMRVWQQGREAENKLMDRVMARVEMADGFDYSKNYGILLLGDFSLRKRYYDEPYVDNDVSVLGWSFRAPWETMTYFNFYAPRNFIYTNYRNYWNFDFVDRLLPTLALDTLEFIQTKAKVWPDKDSVFIKNGTIFIILEKGLLNEFKGKIAQYLRKNPILKERKVLSLYHPNWKDGVEEVEFLTPRRVIHPQMNILANVESETEDQIVLIWDCCGREVFVKNSEGVYEFKSKQKH